MARAHTHKESTMFQKGVNIIDSAAAWPYAREYNFFVLFAILVDKRRGRNLECYLAYD